MSHTLMSPTVDDEGTVRFACSCGFWSRYYSRDIQMRPHVLQDTQSAHDYHRFLEGSEELRTSKPKVTLEGVLRTMSEFAQESMQAAVAMESFLYAHQKAQESGVGIVVMRRPDGTLHPTPSVFIPRGSVVFMEAPGSIAFQPEFDFPREVKYTVSPVPEEEGEAA